MTPGDEAAPVAGQRLGQGLFGAGVLEFAAVLAARPLADADLGWHLAEGRAIVGSLAIPAVDPFAYTHRPVQRVDLIGDVLLYLTARLGGPAALQVGGALLALAIAVALLALTRRAAPSSRLIVALSLAGLSSWLLVRPVMLSFLFFPVLLLLLQTHREAPASRSGRRALALVLPLLFLWSNTHGFAILGATLALAYAGCRLGARIARGRSSWLAALFPPADGEAAGWSAGVILASVLAMMVTPGGPRAVFGGPLRALNDVTYVTEWAHTGASFLYGTEQAAALVLVVTMVALVAGREPDGRRCPPLFDLVVLALALVLGRAAIRFIPVAILLAAPFSARRLGTLIPVTPLMHVATGFAMLLVAPAILLRPGLSLGVGFDRRFQPEGAVEYILSARPSGHMWNFSPYGGYLIWRLYPEHLVLMDGRTAWVHDPSVSLRVEQSNFDRGVFLGLVEEFDIQWAVSRAGYQEPFGVPLTRAAGWVMVYVDDYSAVYVRRDGPNRALADAGYRLLDHLMPLEAVLGLAMSPTTDPEALAQDAALAVRQDPSSARAALIQVCAALSLRDRAGFRAAMERLDTLVPGNPAIPALERAWAEALRDGATPRSLAH